MEIVRRPMDYATLGPKATILANGQPVATLTVYNTHDATTTAGYRGSSIRLGRGRLRDQAAGLLEQETHENPMTPMPNVVIKIETCLNHILRPVQLRPKPLSGFPVGSDKEPE